MIGENSVLKDAEGNEYAKAFVKTGQERCAIKLLKEAHPRTYKSLQKEGIIKRDKDSRQLSIVGSRR